MKTFKIAEKEIVVRVRIYEVEAENKEQALELYCEKLAGSINPVRTYTKGFSKGDTEDVTVID